MTSSEYVKWLTNLLRFVQTSEIPNNVDNTILHTIKQKLKTLE